VTKLELQVSLLKSAQGLSEDQAKAVTDVIRSHTADALNAGQMLLAISNDPDHIRGFIEDYGVTFDGKAKKFR
jgi:hypothetical protein